MAAQGQQWQLGKHIAKGKVKSKEEREGRKFKKLSTEN